MQVGNELLLALEDIIYFHASASEDCRTTDASGVAALEKERLQNDILIKIRDLFNIFQSDVKSVSKEIILKDSRNLDIEVLYFIDSYYIDSLIDEIRGSTDKEKAIEEVYDICHQIRKTLKQLKNVS